MKQKIENLIRVIEQTEHKVGLETLKEILSELNNKTELQNNCNIPVISNSVCCKNCKYVKKKYCTNINQCIEYDKFEATTDR